jgi:condensin complex subunit 1
MIEKPCRQRDWFGMAELVINTVYALGLQPDQWCEGVIKTLTSRVFGPKEAGNRDDGDQVVEDASEQGGEDGEEKRSSEEELDEDGDVTMSQANSTFTQSLKTQNLGKDSADGFKMSQLIFVVGHVALKQVVFMEIVERELKRQKDEKLAGMSMFLRHFSQLSSFHL